MNSITTRQEITKLSSQLQNGADEFRKALPSHITPDKFQRTIITAVQADPALLNADRGSLLNACMKAAQDGLLPDKREAALVIFSTSKKDAQGQWQKVQLVQYMPMVYGLRKKVLQSAEVKDITAQVVYKCEIDEGLFVYERGTNNELRHRPKLTMTEEECSDDNIALAYSIATFQDGSKSDELMRRFEIDKVRQSSQTGAVGKVGLYGKDKGKAIEPKGPWVDWFAEQCKKTVMRRHTKTLPMSGDVIDVEAMNDATAARSTAETLQRGEPHAPVVMPSRAELSQSREPEPVYDADTGEVADDAETEREAARLSGQGDDFGEEEADGANDSIGMIVKQIVDELAARKTVPDINSLMASDSIRSVMSDIGGDAAAQIEAVKNARIAEIQNGGN